MPCHAACEEQIHLINGGLDALQLTQMQFSIGTVPWRFESKAAIAAHWSQAMLDQGGHAIHEANCHGWGEDFKLWAHKAFWEVTGFEAWQIIVEDGRRRIWELPNEWHQVGEEHVAASICAGKNGESHGLCRRQTRDKTPQRLTGRLAIDL